MQPAGPRQLRDCVAIVTGAGGLGSGRAIARRFARDGAAVVVSDINEPGGRETVRLIAEAGGRAAFMLSDIGVEEQARALIAFAETTFGGVDILINNASAPYPGQALLAGWFAAVQVDLLGTMYATWHALEAMRRRGAGSIVNIGSTSAVGHGAKPSASPGYDVAKAGVMRLATMLGPLAAQEKIRVNCLVPDWVATPEVKEYWDGLTPEDRRRQGVPDVLTTLDEIAAAVVELATDESLAGRVMVWWSGQPRRLIAWGDPGYASWE